MSLSEEVGDVPSGCPLCLVSAQALLTSAHWNRPVFFLLLTVSLLPVVAHSQLEQLLYSN